MSAATKDLKPISDDFTMFFVEACSFHSIQSACSRKDFKLGAGFWPAAFDVGEGGGIKVPDGKLFMPVKL